MLSVISRNIVLFALMGLPLSGIPAALVSVGRLKATEDSAFGLLVLLGGIMSLVMRTILIGAVIFGATRDLDGEPASFGECLAAGRRKWGTLLGLSILSSLAIGVGLILLIAPGIFLALRWAVAGPAVVLSGRGVQDSMVRSATLTEGRRWAMLLFYTIVYVALIVVAFLVGVVQGLVTVAGAKTLAAALINPLITVCFDVTISVAAAVLYRRLRDDAEGAPTAVLAEVFA